MMKHSLERGPAIECLQATIPMLDLAEPTIPFRKLPLPEIGLTFLPSRSLLGLRKRGRAAADVDGEHSCLQKKKRRLRLFLITSRLSPQFSHPATNIVDRGSSKIAVWAKQKNLGRNLLRKAAVLNRIRRRAVSAREAVEGRGRVLVEQEKEQRQLEMARLTFNYGSIDTYTRPVHSETQSVPPSTAVRNGGHFLVSGSPTGSPSHSPNTSRIPSPTSLSPPHPSDCCSPNAAYALSPPRAQPSRRDYEPLLPSPLGLSNYDAFDIEDEVTDAYSHLNDDESYSYLWDENEDERHDSPFSSSVVTNDSHATVRTGTSQILKTPPQAAYDDFDDALDMAGSLLGAFDGANADADSAWPSPFVSAETKASAPPKYGGASPNFPAMLAVQPPNTPASLPNLDTVIASPAGSPNFAPAAMSPNFRAIDALNKQEEMGRKKHKAGLDW